MLLLRLYKGDPLYETIGRTGTPVYFWLTIKSRHWRFKRFQIIINNYYK